MSRECELYADALVGLARGQLAGEPMERVEAHVAGCRDCRGALEAIRAVQSAPAPVPEGLAARIQAEVRRELVGDPADADPILRLESRRRARRWRVWALPLAAAAALVIWLGASELLTPDGGVPAAVEVAEYEPYGAWPASDGIVAGDLVLTELSVEELETLLEEM